MPQRWNKKSLRLKEKDGWKSKLGHTICVIDRGAINVRDCPQPNDNCLLSVSRMHIPTAVADQFQ
jgi:hypothetical protein